MIAGKHSTIGIVGPCGAGKTTLAHGLKERGYKAHPIAQEHSFVPAMWQDLSKPDVLIFLQASHQVCAQRKRMVWTEAEWREQQDRLSHARLRADYSLNTDTLSIPEVLQAVMAFLEGK